MSGDVDDTRRRLLEAADFMTQGRAVYVPDLLLTAARLLGRMAREAEAVAPMIRAAEAEECAKAGRKAWPKAHTYASENADIYRAQDHAVERVLAAIRARHTKEAGV